MGIDRNQRRVLKNIPLERLPSNPDAENRMAHVMLHLTTDMVRDVLDDDVKLRNDTEDVIRAIIRSFVKSAATDALVKQCMSIAASHLIEQIMADLSTEAGQLIEERTRRVFEEKVEQEVQARVSEAIERVRKEIAR